MKCLKPDCGFLNQKDAIYCGGCGSKLRTEKIENKIPRSNEEVEYESQHYQQPHQIKPKTNHFHKYYWVYVIVVLSLTYVIYGYIAKYLPSSNYTSNTSTATQTNRNLYVTKKNTSSYFFAAFTKSDLDLLVKRLGDIEVINKMLDSGVIFFLKEGVEVYKEDQSWGAVKLRKKGETQTFWTFSEAIRNK